mgnify:CR=1 FL=1
MESYEIFWNNVKTVLEAKVSNLSFTMYISFLKAVDVKRDKLILCSQSETFSHNISSALSEKIREAIIEQGTHIKDFEIITPSQLEDIATDSPYGSANEPQGMPIDPKFTLENFVVGSSNEFAYAAAKAVSEEPGEAYNPLFIYGGTGLGKTHLMMAIANKLKATNPTTNVMYVTCEKFTNDLVEMVSHGANRGQEFRNRYRNVDVLLIDDIQFISNKTTTQTEFFHTFNELVMQRKQIVLVSDRHPSEIALLEDRLRTRFEGGLITEIQPPEIETRIAILKRKADERKCIIPMDVLTYIAETSDNDVRTLIGKLTNVIFASKLHEKAITVDFVKEALNEVADSDQEEIEVDDIIKTVADFYHITKADLIGKKKNKEFTEPRQICCYLITDLMSLPLVTVGKMLGGRDHTTVIYSRDKIAELISVNPKIATEVNDLKNMILKK